MRRLSPGGWERRLPRGQFIIEKAYASFARGDVALGNCTWKHKTTGVPASVKMVHVWTVDEGKAIAFQQHIDTARVRELS